jgi:Ca2+-binding RTX toxin-like protein
MSKFNGGDFDDSLVGGDGRDRIMGHGGDDTILGGGGPDTLRGGGGDDLLVWSDGNDILNGKGGIDTADFSGFVRDAGKSGVTVDMRISGGQHILGLNNTDFVTLMGIENLVGSDYADRLIGDEGDNVISGGRSSDTLAGGLGDDTLVGGGGGDWASYEEAAGGVRVSMTGRAGVATGADGHDTLHKILNIQGSGFGDMMSGDESGLASFYGGDGDDSISGAGRMRGDGGNDTLTATVGHGAVMIGDGAAEGGVDTFAFLSTEGGHGAKDLIEDLENHDVVDLSAIDADTTSDGDQAFTRVDQFTGHAGEATLGLSETGGYTLLALDTDGDGEAEMTVVIVGEHADFANFVL